MMTKLLGALGALAVLFSLACGDRCPPSPPPDAPARGTLSVQWTITIDAGQLDTCALSGATAVALTLHPHTGGSDITQTASCVASTVSFAADVGTYDVTATLLTPDGGIIATVTPQPNVTISASQATALAPISFIPAARTGEVALRIVAVGQSTNCQTMTGKPITGNVLALHAIDGRCADVSITRSRGGVFVGKYIASCAHPIATTCFEQDETLTIDGGLTAGQYAITVSGQAGPAVCFHTDEVLMVGGGITNHPTIQLAPLGGLNC